MIEGTYTAQCGCSWETGSWEICDAHRKPHAEHDPERPAPWCDECSIPFVDDEVEPEDVCRGCGQPWISHMRTDADNFCPECRFADWEDK